MAVPFWSRRVFGKLQDWALSAQLAGRMRDMERDLTFVAADKRRVVSQVDAQALSSDFKKS